MPLGVPVDPEVYRMEQWVCCIHCFTRAIVGLFDNDVMVPMVALGLVVTVTGVGCTAVLYDNHMFYIGAQSASDSRVCKAWEEKPPKVTKCTAPIRAQASMLITASGVTDK